MLIFSNNANSTTAGSITPTDLTVNIAAGTGVLFPQPTTGQEFIATFIDQLTGTLREIVHVTAVNADSLTIVRAQEGTIAQAWPAGSIFAHLHTAGAMAAFIQGSATSLVHAGTDTGNVNSIVAACIPVSTGYPVGEQFNIVIANTNTGGVVANFDGNGQRPVLRPDGTALHPGDLIVGNGALFVSAGAFFNVYGGSMWNAGGGGGPSGVPEAPTDGQLYGRQNSTWQVVPAAGPGGGIGEAPINGQTFGRKNGGWSTLNHLDITDWNQFVPQPSTSTPLMDGVAAVGTQTAYSRGDHRHPTDTTRAAVADLNKYLLLSLASMQSVTGPVSFYQTSILGLHIRGQGAGTYVGAAESPNSADICLSKSGSGFLAQVLGTNSGVKRWQLVLGNATAESSGTNNGSGFAIGNFTDAGNPIALPLQISRATSVVTFSNQWVISSDERLKENVAPIEDALEKVLSLQGVTFNRIGTDWTEMGFIAQQISPIVPEVIQETPPQLDQVTHELIGQNLTRDGTDAPLLGVSYGQLTALLVEAVKTLSAQVDELRARIGG
jgi:Chaperone of endosialidase